MWITVPLASFLVTFAFILTVLIFSESIFLKRFRSLRLIRKRLPDWLKQSITWGYSCAALILFFVVWWFSSRPVFGLLVVFFIPALFSLGLGAWKYFRTLQLDVSAISFFYGLQGMIASGIGFSHALLLLTQMPTNPFGQLMQAYLKRLKEGQSIRDCLRQARIRGGLQQTRTWLTLLELAYERGLPMLGLVTEIIFILDQRCQLLQRRDSLRIGALGQALIALAVPWVILAVMNWFMPDSREGRRETSVYVIMVVSLAWQFIGVFLIWKLSDFFNTKKRAWIQQVICFLDALELFLGAGFDLSYAWPKAVQVMNRELDTTLVFSFSSAHSIEGASAIGNILSSLEKDFMIVELRVWFTLLKNLYLKGSPLLKSVTGFRQALRNMQKMDLENYSRSLPTKLNVVLIVFFLPPVMLIVGVVLLGDLESALWIS